MTASAVTSPVHQSALSWFLSIFYNHAQYCLQTASSGAFDGSLERLLPIVEADLFSDLADAKEAAPFAGNFR